MPGVPLPKPISVAQFVPDPNEPTFTQIFTDTMGNLGSPADGFDDAFNDLVAMQPPNGGQDAVMGPAGLQLSQVRNAIATGSLRTLLPGLASAIAAGNDKFNTVAHDVAPASQKQPPVTPPTTNPPVNQQSACGPWQASDNPRVFATTAVGGAPLTEFVDEEVYPVSAAAKLSVKLFCGDPAVFAVQVVQKITPAQGQSPATITATWSLVMTPSKAGQFYAEVEDDTQTGSNSYQRLLFKYSALITAA